MPVTKSGEQLSLTFQAFRENRLPFTIRVKDPHQEPMGRVAFMREPRVGRGEPPQTPICNLNIVLPEVCNFQDTFVCMQMIRKEIIVIFFCKHFHNKVLLISRLTSLLCQSV